MPQVTVGNTSGWAPLLLELARDDPIGCASLLVEQRDRCIDRVNLPFLVRVFLLILDSYQDINPSPAVFQAFENIMDMLVMHLEGMHTYLLFEPAKQLVQYNYGKIETTREFCLLSRLVVLVIMMLNPLSAVYYCERLRHNPGATASDAFGSLYGIEGPLTVAHAQQVTMEYTVQAVVACASVVLKVTSTFTRARLVRDIQVAVWSAWLRTLNEAHNLRMAKKDNSPELEGVGEEFFHQQLTDNKSCAICCMDFKLEDMAGVARYKVCEFHMFHTTCAERWKNNGCPTCRRGQVLP